MGEDKISLTKEIKFKIITPENLIELIDIIYEDYEKNLNLFNEKKEEKEPKFTITLLKSDGESNETREYKKLKEEKKLYNTNYEGIKVSYTEGKEENRIEFAIIAQRSYFRREIFSDEWNNGIKISGKNEEWVRSKFDKINRIISNWKDQCKIFKECYGIISILFIAFWCAIIGGVIYIFTTFFHLIETWWFFGVIGFIIAIFLGVTTSDKIAQYFPYVELLTGPNHLHYEDEKRKNIIFFILVIVIPFLFVLIGILLTNLITKTP
ncbi:hypothetical protein [uncultured Methanoregula sp.]|uniref:hypothetical protein n=1 Tax=uncultured Methanoregula sp. TaxID=1005933 RepID=UPI002AAC3ACD|nr:hypothetical protein [uncultured Methanoregula sp.]